MTSPTLLVPREQIYSTLAARYAALVDPPSGGAPAAGRLAKFSRRWKLWSECSATDSPALFMVQAKEHTSKSTAMPPSWSAKVDLFLYIWTGNDTTDDVIPSMLLNPITDAIEASMYDSWTEFRQTLGEIVTEARIDGDIDIYEGVFDNWLVALIPVTIIMTQS